MIEATLAQPGQHFITSYLNERDLLPGFREGMDERRAGRAAPHRLRREAALRPLPRGPGVPARRRGPAARGDPLDGGGARPAGLGPPLHRGVRLHARGDRRQRARTRSRPSCAAPGCRSRSCRARRSSRPTGCRGARRARAAARQGGVLGEKTGPPLRDPETMAALFEMLRGGPRQPRRAARARARSSGTSPTPSRGTWSWRTATRGCQPGRAGAPTVTHPVPLRGLGGRVRRPRAPAAAGRARRLRPSGDLRWLWRARRMFPS